MPLTSISKMIVNNNRLELPKDEVFKDYALVKKTLTKAGGKYKRNGFEFAANAQQVLDRLLGGETIDDKKKFQFFPTPKHLVEKIIDIAEISKNDLCLEPSAGNGNISSEILKLSKNLTSIELNPEVYKELLNIDKHAILGDFLQYAKETENKFDKIIANPPFNKNQDVDHVLAMHSLLDSGGKLVSIVGVSWFNGIQKKHVSFREWLDSVNANIIHLDGGEFKESGTSVKSIILEIDKE